jgi:hypothetical protein
MANGTSTEMVSTVFYIGWLYVGQVRNYLNDLIEEKGWPVKYSESVRFFENRFEIYGNQRDVMYIHQKLQQHFQSFDF